MSDQKKPYQTPKIVDEGSFAEETQGHVCISTVPGGVTCAPHLP